ncbi:MAG: M28 family peptidase [Chitinophagales bacterium]|nr:M28 family peptidase [Chitinophagales bacterium]MBP8753043.1 M28 family peptidase [Chitinophagales bacterium]MBP9189035.1 M28 family peptidase [Chitinophagales bacterium]MBP9549423.1 M28 family peptidase [Chitinophagales bacterium]MBP9703518.1 M28 family peptidase [Chitinophagales bacterium]
MRKYLFALVPLLLILSSVFAQDKTVIELKEHITYLSDDKLEGRLTGSKGEMMAAEYIAADFKALGLTPFGDNKTYIQSFTFSAGKEATKNNFITVGNKQIDYPEVYPLVLSGTGNISAEVIDLDYGISADSIDYNDYSGKNVKGKIVLVKLSSPEGYHPHTKFYPYADERSKVNAAIENGAAGIIFYNVDSNYETPRMDYTMKTSAVSIPAMYVTESIAEKIIAEKKPVTLETELLDIEKTGHNILGFIDNHAKETIVIGAHYDHLGYNEMGGSLYRGKPAIHNGADDNASGTAMIMELAEALQLLSYKNNNYLFIAFSGEELGLYGSKYSASSKALEPLDINYMLNFDMVGRLDEENNLIINGVGTSPAFANLDTINNNRFVLKTTESGVGPSDHTSFYLKDIPVLHFFTGTHSDYHKPSDDEDKINYDGIELIQNYVIDIIANYNAKGKIEFMKTKEDSNENAPRFTVTLGVIPDYIFEGKGMRIDAVTEDRPAAKAGLLAGDIVVKLGPVEVVDMMSYMKALSMFEKGDATTVHVMRGEENMEFKVQF